MFHCKDLHNKHTDFSLSLHLNICFLYSSPTTSISSPVAKVPFLAYLCYGKINTQSLKRKADRCHLSPQLASTPIYTELCLQVSKSPGLTAVFTCLMTGLNSSLIAILLKEASGLSLAVH